jgi:hypothetical protein
VSATAGRPRIETRVNSVRNDCTLDCQAVALTGSRPPGPVPSVMLFSSAAKRVYRAETNRRV